MTQEEAPTLEQVLKAQAGFLGLPAGAYATYRGTKNLREVLDTELGAGNRYFSHGHTPLKETFARAVGAQPVFHGTYADRAQPIAEQGLLRSKALTGEGSRFLEGPMSPEKRRYLQDSKDAIFVAGRPGNASWYADTATAPDGTPGKIVAGVLPEDFFKQHFLPDETAGNAFLSRTTDIPAGVLHEGPVGWGEIWKARSKGWAPQLLREPERLKAFKRPALAAGATLGALGLTGLAGKALYDSRNRPLEEAKTAGARDALALFGL